MKDIYDPTFVNALFNEMSATYGIVNFISSFGFCARWRRQCVAQIPLKPGDRVIDLMAGMGELSHFVNARIGTSGKIIGVDFSQVMCETAQKNLSRQKFRHAIVLDCDALNTGLANGSADAVVSSFGLKTFSNRQIQTLASEVTRVLKPGGHFAFLEISVPSQRLLQLPYLFYLRRLIPLIGWLFLGNPDNYRLLSVYTSAFKDCSQAVRHFEAAGLRVERTDFFFGCATGIKGYKPTEVTV